MTSETTEEQNYKAPDFSTLSKEQCIVEAEKLLTHIDTSFASKSFNTLREHLDSIIRAEREVALKEYADQGKELKDFKAAPDPVKDEFYKHFNAFRERRKKEKEQAEAEKVKNLKAKQAILDELKSIIDSEETEGSLEKVRELQTNWKQIRQVPRDQMEDLWETYKVLLDTFYDNLSINRELKELDRDKNLQHKIELIQKVDALKEEKNTRRAFNYLNKYHEDFKNTGPVPREHNEAIWQRFKAASDAIIELKTKDLEEIKEKQKENYKLKVLLCEKVEQYGEIPYSTPKEWKDKTQEVDAIFEEWKSIGRVPSDKNDEIWNRFKEGRTNFLNNRKKYFKKLNADKTANLEKKLALCEKAESVKDDLDNANKTAEFLKSLQVKWKQIGPVPDKESDKVWKRFRAACDAFFKAREITFAAKKEEELENLEKKKKLLTQLEELSKEENSDKAFTALKSIQKEWYTIGFVPIKKKKDIESKYENLGDAIYSKFNKSRSELNQGKLKEHYTMLSEAPNGGQRLQDEERKVRDRLKKLQGEIESYENNIQFFNLSKGSENFLNDINKKIEKAHKSIENLKKELKTIQQFKKSNAK